MSEFRSFGGHRHGLAEPTFRQLGRNRRVDALLHRILGGVPRAPRRTPLYATGPAGSNLDETSAGGARRS